VLTKRQRQSDQPERKSTSRYNEKSPVYVCSFEEKQKGYDKCHILFMMFASVA